MSYITRGLAVMEYALLNPDGSVIENWRTLGHTDFDSPVTQVESEPTKDGLKVHENDEILDMEYTAGEKPIVFSLINPTLQVRALLIGGTVTGSGAAAKLEIPEYKTPLECAFRILPKKGDMYRANHVKLWGRRNADYAKASKVLYDVAGDVLKPINPAVITEQEGPIVTSIRGGVDTGTVLEGGDGYTNGTFTNVRLTHISGSGCLATVTVASGEVTTVVITAPGKNYHVGSVLNAPGLAGGTGFEYVVSTVV